MKEQAAGLYLLQDGTHADPSECSAGKDGVLRHKNGLAVAMDANGAPQTVAGDAMANKNVEAAAAGKGDAERQGGERAAAPAPATGARHSSDDGETDRR